MKTQIKTTHTPGPWTAQECRILAKGIQLAATNSTSYVGNIERTLAAHDESVSNARLIAAAPELLAALEKLAFAIAGLPRPAPPLNSHRSRNNMGGRKDPASRSAYMAEYQSRPEVAARRKAYNRTPERKKIMRETMRKAIQDPRLRARHEARWKLRREIVEGRMVRQPCENCAAPKADAHHEDYAKPLEVKWLCRKCHGKEHRKYKLAQEVK